MRVLAVTGAVLLLSSLVCIIFNLIKIRDYLENINDELRPLERIPLNPFAVIDKLSEINKELQRLNFQQNKPPMGGSRDV